MTTNSIPSSAKLPPKSLNKDTQDDELPETNLDDRRAPPVNMGNSREAGEGVTDADPKTGRADARDHNPAPQTANRK
ncbi:hypothetical protein QTL95_17895 [Rhizobium sp. S152]|uniref:hypothetical protein n=1 Tax=Rhizobium sp. S152 TaxID=3055038 RepID=UPI0025A9C93F|nr:hypothetical protein [Rhizobium sp. S152]MDM9627768.1 hypothetical protein [Rhizobium sp. S152]